MAMMRSNYLEMAMMRSTIRRSSTSRSFSCACRFGFAKKFHAQSIKGADVKKFHAQSIKGEDDFINLAVRSIKGADDSINRAFQLIEKSMKRSDESVIPFATALAAVQRGSSLDDTLLPELESRLGSMVEMVLDRFSRSGEGRSKAVDLLHRALKSHHKSLRAVEADLGDYYSFDLMKVEPEEKGIWLFMKETEALSLQIHAYPGEKKEEEKEEKKEEEEEEEAKRIMLLTINFLVEGEECLRLECRADHTHYVQLDTAITGNNNKGEPVRFHSLRNSSEELNYALTEYLDDLEVESIIDILWRKLKL